MDKHPIIDYGDWHRTNHRTRVRRTEKPACDCAKDAENFRGASPHAQQENRDG